MDFDEFTGQVQNRLELAGTGETLQAIRVTLTTLGERLQEGEAEDLAAPLPTEIGRFLTEGDEHGQRFGWDEFVDRIWERQGMEDSDERADAAYHARAVLAVVAEAAPEGELEDVRTQLPEDEDWAELFELVDQEAQAQ